MPKPFAIAGPGQQPAVAVRGSSHGQRRWRPSRNERSMSKAVLINPRNYHAHCPASAGLPVLSSSCNQKRILSSFGSRLAIRSGDKRNVHCPNCSAQRPVRAVGTKGAGPTERERPGGANVCACFTPVVNSCLANGGGRDTGRTNSLGQEWRGGAAGLARIGQSSVTHRTAKRLTAGTSSERRDSDRGGGNLTTLRVGKEERIRGKD